MHAPVRFEFGPLPDCIGSERGSDRKVALPSAGTAAIPAAANGKSEPYPPGEYAMPGYPPPTANHTGKSGRNPHAALPHSSGRQTVPVSNHCHSRNDCRKIPQPALPHCEQDSPPVRNGRVAAESEY